MTLLNTAAAVRKGSQVVSRVYAGTTLVWPPFNPASLPGLMVWLDASQLTQADTAPIPALPDRSGNGRDALQPTASFQPLCVRAGLGGLRVATFDGVDDGMLVAPITWPAQQTVIVLGKALDAVPGQDGYVNAGTNPTRLFQVRQQDAATVQVAGFDSAGTGYVSNQPCTTQAWHRIAYVRGPATVDAFIDGASTGSTATAGTPATPSVNLWIGSGNFQARPGAVQLAEVIVYDHALTPADRAQVEAYLLHKWLS